MLQNARKQGVVATYEIIYKSSILTFGKYVTGFGKMCIVHTSDFEYFEIHKSHSEYYTELKLSGMIEE